MGSFAVFRLWNGCVLSVASPNVEAALLRRQSSVGPHRCMFRSMGLQIRPTAMWSSIFTFSGPYRGLVSKVI